MKNKSIWEEGFPYDVCDKLNNNIEVDVLIVGGGMSGMNTAYSLLNSNLKVCLVERNYIGFGKTLRTTGKINYLQDKNIVQILKYHGFDIAKEYVKYQMYAVQRIKEIIEKEKIDCNFDENNAYTFSFKNNKDILKISNILDSLNIKYKYKTKIYDGNKVYLLSCKDNYVFHPLKYLYSIKRICLEKKISIYENTGVLKIKKNNNLYECITDNNCTIKCKYVVITTHYPYFIKPFFLPFKTYITKSYIECFKRRNNMLYNAISVDNPVVSSRFYSNNDVNYQLLLSLSHNLAFKNNTLNNFEKLNEYSNQNVDYMWSNMDIVPADYLPYIGRINDNENVFIATGYNAWGMSNSVIAGDEIASLILTGKSKYNDLFKPKRNINKGFILNLPLVVFSNFYSFIKSKLIRSSNVKYKVINGKKIAIYVDENNIEHKVYPICPHLKCSLKFNVVEKTWDCPCHSSRFDIDGNVLEGPSNYDIKYKE